MFRFLFAALAALFAFASVALAAPVTLDDRAEAQLDAGERARVIVWLAAPSASDAAEAGIESDAASATISAVSNAVMMRVFGVPAARMAEAAPGSDQPRIAREFRYTPVLAMELNRDEIARLSQDEGVRRIEADELSRPYLNVSVPLIGATALHNGGNTGAGVAVAILDTGVDHEHPMFAGRITASACFSTTASGSTSLCPAGAPTDTTTPGAGDDCAFTGDTETPIAGCGHGTHVAGIAAGASFVDPGTGDTLIGVAPGANIIAVQVFSRFTNSGDCGSSVPCALSYSTDQLAALEWLYTNRTTFALASINMSLGGGTFTAFCNTDSRFAVINNLRTAGVATAIASGNNGFSNAIGAPGCVEPAITVGATNDSDVLASFSNSATMVDVLAPGVSINAAAPTIDDTLPGRARSISGTSMATPHVAGAIALLRASRPTASMDAIENALEATGIPVTNGNNNITSPRIRVDLADAQLAANSGGTVAGVMTVSPLIAFSASGSGSDGSNYGSREYTLTNTSGSSITWQAVGSADWIVLEIVAGGGGADGPGGSASDTESGSLAAGNSVIVRASVNPAGLSGGSYLGTITFAANGASPGLQVAASLAVSIAPPVNDNFANALVLTQPSQVVAFNNSAATKESGEPNHVSGGGASVWWSWTAPVSGQVRAETQSAGFDTMMGVYTGSAVNALSVVGQNDDIAFPSNTQSRVDFTATAGTTYRIAVDGYNGASGNANLSVGMLAAPANDNLASAETLAGANGSVSASNVNATLETGESQHGGTAGGASVWFAWQAPASGPVAFTATGGSAALLASYSANSHGGTAISQSASGSIDFTAASGTTYYIALDGTGGAQGLFSLTWAQGPDPAHRLRAAVLPNARSVTVGNTATAFATVINPASFGAGGTNCRIEAPASFNGAFTFRRTDPGTNAPVGNNGDTVSLASGGSQTYVLSMTPGAAMNGAVLAPVFLCDDIRPTDPIPGVTTVTLTASAVQTADIVSIAATPTANGILDVPLNGARAFSVAAVNIGAAQTVTITPGTGGVSLPLTIDMCETNPATGACLTGRTPTVAVNFAANETRTFSIFVRSTGAVAFTPSTNRVFVTFTNATPATVGATGVAVRTQ
ncbi:MULTISPECIES: S8 family serine peptidase [Hyphobacterium]|uniref:S8 family serine peptidase n=1 Tax=Hyphobacterium vulgare TaxID=1736751 RepID=A0ABV6ZVA9_9PROT